VALALRRLKKISKREGVVLVMRRLERKLAIPGMGATVEA
jgi:hypothetical protein